MKPKQVIGKRLELKEISKNDLPVLFKWRNLDSFILHCTAERSKCASIEDLDLELKGDYLFDKFIQFIAYDKAMPIGTCWIYRYEQRVGYAYFTTFVAPEYIRNKFYGVEMFALSCDYLFNDLQCKKVYFEVHSDNEESMRIFSRKLFVLEGKLKTHVFRESITYADLLIYALYKDDFYSNAIIKKYFDCKM